MFNNFLKLKHSSHKTQGFSLEGNEIIEHDNCSSQCWKVKTDIKCFTADSEKEQNVKKNIVHDCKKNLYHCNATLTAIQKLVNFHNLRNLINVVIIRTSYVHDDWNVKDIKDSSKESKIPKDWKLKESKTLKDILKRLKESKILKDL